MPVSKMLRLTEAQLLAIAPARVRGPVAVDMAAGTAPRVPGQASRTTEAGSAAGRNDAAAQIQTVMLPWPSPMLSPNARAHWAQKSRLSKSYRAACALHTKCAGLKVDWDGLVHVAITFFPPDRRHRDMDNLIASIKALLDGVADALCVNDRRFRIHPVLSDDTHPGGAVMVELFRRVEDLA